MQYFGENTFKNRYNTCLLSYIVIITVKHYLAQLHSVFLLFLTKIMQFYLEIIVFMMASGPLQTSGLMNSKPLRV